MREFFEAEKVKREAERKGEASRDILGYRSS